MKSKTIYICEVCGTEYHSSKDAFKCEAKCLGLTYEQYKEYHNLLMEERNAFALASTMRSDMVIKRCDDAVKAVLDFQKRYNFKSDFVEGI